MFQTPNKNFYAIIGLNPSKGARSPTLWNKYLKKDKKKIRMLPLDIPIKGSKNLIKNLLVNKYFCGGAIAVPYKETIANLLKKNNLSISAREIGAVNCLYRKKKELYGVNTDGLAFLETLKFYKLNYKKILIMGFGGAGKAIYYTLKSNTKNKIITVVTRSERKIHDMKKKKIRCFSWHNLTSLLNHHDIIVNCTSVGYTNARLTPISENIIKKINKKKIFYDIIYQPLETRLLKIAKKYNHQIINGLKMNLLQACIAISMATNKKNFYKIEKIISEKNKQ